jgi:hypothetical protein
MTYCNQFLVEGQVVADITMALVAHAGTAPNACWALAAAPFRDGADLARFCSGTFRKLDLCTDAVPMLIANIESCFEPLGPNSVRMLVKACALVVFKVLNDYVLLLVDAAELLDVDFAQLRAAEHYVISVLLQTSHPSGRRVNPTGKARPLISSYAAYAPACAIVMRGLASTHIACSWRRTLAVRTVRTVRAARSATRKLAAKLHAAAKLAAAITMQRAYRKAALASGRVVAPSPTCIMSFPVRAAPVATKVAFVFDSDAERRLNQSMRMAASVSLRTPSVAPLVGSWCI